MSPLNVKILLHIYAIVADYRDEPPMDHARSEAVRDTFKMFVSDGLIEPVMSDDEWRTAAGRPRDSQYRVTQKGEAMVDAICAVQVPVCKWVQPEPAR